MVTLSPVIEQFLTSGDEQQSRIQVADFIDVVGVGSDYAVRAASVVHVVDIGSYVHGVDAAWYEATSSLP
jgi:hypothetical protein